MSFFLRKSLRFGPIRFNLSKSGIGVSAGVKGLRIGKGPRGNYVSAGRGGIYYRKTLGGKTTGQSATQRGLPLNEFSPAQLANPRADETYQKERRGIWPWLVIASVILGALMIANSLPQTWIVIAMSCLFLLCFVAALFERQRKTKNGNLDHGIWIDYDQARTIFFRIAPAKNRAFADKFLKLAGGGSSLPPNIDPALIIEAMIDTVLLDWHGVTTDDGKPFEYSTDNARTLLSQSDVIRDFVSEEAVRLNNLSEKRLEPSTSFVSPEELDLARPKVVDTTALPTDLPGSRKKPSLSELRAKEKKPTQPTAANQQTWDAENYTLPSIDLLEEHRTGGRTAASLEELERVQQTLIETLGQFGIAITAGEITKGTTVTRYEVYPANDVLPDELAKLEGHLARATDAEHINIVAQTDGKKTIGIEVPNAGRTDVSLFDVLATQDWEDAKLHAELPFALGKDVYGKVIIPNLSELSHILIAGTTGSGKSVCIDAMIASLLFRFTPAELRFVMIDLRRAQMQIYNALPHLAFPVITDPKKVLLALRWVFDEMEKRYRIFAQTGVRTLTSFNARPPKTAPSTNVASDDELVIPDKMPYVLVIIDELADLMQNAAADIESAIARITQMARATGIHLIVATQTPRADVITGAIKANIPSRIAFHVASKIDSRVILEENGADRLLGQGDMLYRPPSTSRLIRAQGALVTENEIRRIVEFVSAQSPPAFNLAMQEKLQLSTVPAEEVTDEDEELVEKCLEVIRQEKRASTSLLQRRLRLGYTRAARIVDILEQRGILGPGEGATPREILVDLDAV
jgi:S-DNA-T family DNA segregation ATPase FtsK/SpoIIIE